MNRIPLVVAVALVIAPAALRAQGVRYLQHTGGFGSIGLTRGHTTLTCNAGCSGSQLQVSGGELQVGYFFTPKLRLELGMNTANSAEDIGGALSAFSVGAGYFLVRGLHVSAAGSFMRPSVTQATGSIESKGGTGVLAAVGYDVGDWKWFARAWSLTPFGTYATSSVKEFSGTGAGASASNATGTSKMMTFGIKVTAAAARWECTRANGTKVRLSVKSQVAFRACVDALPGSSR